MTGGWAEAGTVIAKRTMLALATTASLIAGFEGFRTVAYLDPVAVPTACFGMTKGNEVAGQSWPAPMVHDSGGTYRASLSHQLELTEGQRYTAKVHAVGSDGGVGQREVPVMALPRTE